MNLHDICQFVTDLNRDRLSMDAAISRVLDSPLFGGDLREAAVGSTSYRISIKGHPYIDALLFNSICAYMQIEGIASPTEQLWFLLEHHKYDHRYLYKPFVQTSMNRMWTTWSGRYSYHDGALCWGGGVP